MKNAILLLLLSILTAGTALADVKIRTKQTMSGQTTENTTYIKGKRQRTESMGGTLVSITQCDLRRDLQLNPAAKTYLVNHYDDGTPVPQGQPSVQQTKSVEVTKGGTMYVTTTIRDTGERRQMFGYTARHIIQTVETESSPDACFLTKNKMEMDMWVIDAEFALDCFATRSYRPSNNGKNGACQEKIVPKTIGTAKSGYAVYQKMTSYDATGKETFTMIQEVVEISKATLDASLFEAPADYREVSDPTHLYASAAQPTGINSQNGVNYVGGTSQNEPGGVGANIRNQAQPHHTTRSSAGAKTPGTVRVGLIVKTGSVGEGIPATDLAAAVRNTLVEFLKGTKVEIVPLEARLASAVAEEAKQKECDHVLLATVSHKKGGGGFGGFGKMFSSVAPMIGGGSVVAHVATSAVITAVSLSGNMKAKDEVTLDLNLQAASDNKALLTRQFKAKAKSDGDDIISSIVEQAAQAIIDVIGK